MAYEERKNFEELLKLMQENPELPIVPMVSGELAGDDWGYWLGHWGSAQIDEYLLSFDDERVMFKSDADVMGVLEEFLQTDEFERLPEADEECRPFFDALPWTKAIIVYIEPQEE